MDGFKSNGAQRTVINASSISSNQNALFVPCVKFVILYMHEVVLQRSLPRLDGKLEHFDTKKWKTQCAQFKSDRHEFVRSGAVGVMCSAGDTKVAGSNPASSTSFCH